MAFHDELLAQALQLLHAEPRTQANLRRAVSSAYYAVFHLLIHASVSNWKNEESRAALARAFEHGIMKSASGRILDTKRFPYKDVDPALVKELRQVAKNFIALQDYRHSADYNLTQELEVTDALRQVKLAEEVFTLWPKIETSQIAQNFLVALIVRSRSADRR